MTDRLSRMGIVVERHSPSLSFLLSFGRITAAVALVCTAVFEAIGVVHSSQIEIGAGIIAGAAVAAIVKALHIA